MKRGLVTAVLLPLMIGLILPATPAQAQRVCGKRTEIVRQLGEKYGETRRSMGLANGRGMVEIFASDETGSWTILITSPQGNACLMAAGDTWQPEPVLAVGNPA